MTNANEENRQDIFFLNIEDAYAEASKQNRIDGGRLQYCYYDGPLTDIVLANFIRVPSDDFVVFFSNNQLPIPQLIAVSQPEGVSFSPMPQDIVDEIEAHRSQYRIPQSTHFDTYFIDPLLALNVAKQRNRVYCDHPTIDGLQTCYYRGELPEHGLENLVHIELDKLVDFFVKSRLRFPKNTEIPDELEPELQQAIREDISNALNAIKKKQLVLIKYLIEKARTQEPTLDGEPIRVFLPCRRTSTVMQHCSRGLAKAFEKRGLQAHVHMESNDMETLNYVDFVKAYIDFNPHVIFYINDLRNTFLHEDIVNIIWWQDPMAQIRNREVLKWRKNDFNFSISPLLDDYLKQCGAETIERQHFVIDDDVFYADPAHPREQRAVFVGTSYLANVYLNDPQQQQALKELTAIMDRGGCFDKDTVAGIAERAELTYDFVFWKLLHYAIRDGSVQWLCRQDGVPVDVYGRHWEQDPTVAPFFRGELPHGVELANVYRSAEYAIVCHPFEINSQRLAEVAACGCIPVVYDCRDVAETPHWEQCCLFFKTEAELKHILDNRLQPPQSPLLLAQHFTYDAAVDRFIEKSILKALFSTKAVVSVQNHAEPMLGDDVVLHSRSAETIRICRDHLATNLQILQNSRPELVDELIAGLHGKQVDITVDRLIGSSYWDVSLTMNGEIYYRLDNVALLDNCQSIRDNASISKQENAGCYAFLGLGSGYELLEAIAQTGKPAFEAQGFEPPIYVIEQEPGLFLLNMLLHDWATVIVSKRVRFFNINSIGTLREQFLHPQNMLPTVLLDINAQDGLSTPQFVEIINQAQQQRALQYTD
ncbi:MAG: glycosyltransferase family protein [Methylobacter sp.]